MSQPIGRERRIRMLAYAMWEKSGRPSGAELKHWLAAEQQIDAEDHITRVKTKTKSAKSRGSSTTPMSRKIPLVKAMHAPKTPSRKTPLPSAGTKTPIPGPNSK